MNHLLPDRVLENLARHLLQRAGGHRIAACIKVYWNRRMRSTAGMACYQRKAVFLNPKLIEIAPHEIRRTLRHELAHFLASERAGLRIEPHGAEWREACRDLGIPNEPRCHNLPLRQRAMTRKYFYRCKECGNVLARVRKIRRAMACLPCCRRHNGGQYHERFRFIPTEERGQIAA